MIDTAGSAFPVIRNGYGLDSRGMTLRDYFSAKAMQGILSADQSQILDSAKVAAWAYHQADAMIAARGKSND